MTDPTAVVADTHALVWYVDADERLSADARSTLDAATEADLPIYVPTITLLEMHYLTVRGRVAEGTPARLTQLLSEANSAFEPYAMDTAVAVAATQAPWRLGDPADRIIAGTARVLDIPLVTRDRQLADSGYVTAVW